MMVEPTRRLRTPSPPPKITRGALALLLQAFIALVAEAAGGGGEKDAVSTQLEPFPLAVPLSSRGVPPPHRLADLPFFSHVVDSFVLSVTDNEARHFSFDFLLAAASDDPVYASTSTQQSIQ